jgi:chromosome segregation ATPase
MWAALREVVEAATGDSDDEEYDEVPSPPRGLMHSVEDLVSRTTSERVHEAMADFHVDIPIKPRVEAPGEDASGTMSAAEAGAVSRTKRELEQSRGECSRLEGRLRQSESRLAEEQDKRQKAESALRQSEKGAVELASRVGELEQSLEDTRASLASVREEQRVSKQISGEGLAEALREASEARESADRVREMLSQTESTLGEMKRDSEAMTLRLRVRDLEHELEVVQARLGETTEALQTQRQLNQRLREELTAPRSDPGPRAEDTKSGEDDVLVRRARREKAEVALALASARDECRRLREEVARETRKYEEVRASCVEKRFAGRLLVEWIARPEKRRELAGLMCGVLELTPREKELLGFESSDPVPETNDLQVDPTHSSLVEFVKALEQYVREPEGSAPSASSTARPHRVIRLDAS